MEREFEHTSLFATLIEARRWVADHREEGVVCPCCQQFAKLYKRKLNSGMARALIEIYRIHRRGQEWIDLARMLNPFITYNREWTKLGYWNLISWEDAPPTPSRVHNLYHMTHHGIEFAENRIRVPRQVWIYNNQLFGFSDETVDIVEALGDKFNYRELMGW